MNKKNDKKTQTHTATPARLDALPITRAETITPEIAREMLKNNPRNRVMVKTHIAYFVQLILSGAFRVTNQGIGIATDGSIVDGQHRIAAIAESGVPVIINVTRGLAPESIDAIDTGRPRRAHDILAIADGRKLSTSERAAIVAARNLATHGTLRTWRGLVDIHELRAALVEHGEDMGAVFTALVNSHDRLSSAAMVGSLVCAYRTRPAEVAEFCKLMRSGAGMQEGNPALTLRNYVTLKYVATGSESREKLSLATFAALDAFIDGEPRTQLKGGTAQRARWLLPWRKEDSEK
jgi:hypothetical protein